MSLPRVSPDKKQSSKPVSDEARKKDKSSGKSQQESLGQRANSDSSSSRFEHASPSVSFGGEAVFTDAKRKYLSSDLKKEEKKKSTSSSSSSDTESKSEEKTHKSIVPVNSTSNALSFFSPDVDVRASLQLSNPDDAQSSEPQRVQPETKSAAVDLPRSRTINSASSSAINPLPEQARAIQSILQQFKKDLKKTPYFTSCTDREGKVSREMYFSASHSRDWTVNRLMAAKAPTLSALRRYLWVERSAIQNTGGILNSTNKDDPIVRVLTTAIVAINSAISDIFPEAKDKGMVKINILMACSEKLLILIGKNECSLTYKKNRLFSSDDIPATNLLFQEAEKFSKKLLECSFPIKTSELIPLLEEMCKTISENKKENSELIPVLKEIIEDLGKHASKIANALYERDFAALTPISQFESREHFSGIIQTYGPNLTEFIQTTESSFAYQLNYIGDKELKLLNRARWFFYNLVQCKTADDLEDLVSTRKEIIKEFDNTVLAKTINSLKEDCKNAGIIQVRIPSLTRFQ